jgi:hypothetical protein
MMMTKADWQDKRFAAFLKRQAGIPVAGCQPELYILSGRVRIYS